MDTTQNSCADLASISLLFYFKKHFYIMCFNNWSHSVILLNLLKLRVHSLFIYRLWHEINYLFCNSVKRRWSNCHHPIPYICTPYPDVKWGPFTQAHCIQEVTWWTWIQELGPYSPLKPICCLKIIRKIVVGKIALLNVTGEGFARLKVLMA